MMPKMTEVHRNRGSQLLSNLDGLEGLLGHAAPIPLRPEFGSAEFQALQPPEMWSLETQAPNGQKILEETEEMSKK